MSSVKLVSYAYSGADGYDRFMLSNPVSRSNKTHRPSQELGLFYYVITDCYEVALLFSLP